MILAYSTLEFSGRIARIHDLDLSVACFIVMELGKNISSDFLNEAFESWIDSISYDGPGCIDLRLDSFLKSQERVDVAVSLIEGAIRDLDIMSGEYPKDRLNLMLASAKIKLNADYKIEFINQALIELRRVIGGKE